MLVWATAQLGFRGERWMALAVVVVGAMAVAATARWLSRHGTRSLSLARREGVNLVCTRGRETPRLWLAAHLDTKSQLVPTLLRSAGLVVQLVSVAFAGIGAVLGVSSATYWTATTLAALAGGAPLLLSVVGDRSPGAFDNASGVVTIIEVARALRDVAVGVLITDAEELGLAGARAWTPPPGASVLNCDSVDDVGRVVVLQTGVRAAVLVETIRRASASCGTGCDVRRHPPGVLTDAVAFADAGADSVTFSRGTWWSLARVHSARDNLERLRGTGIAETARLVAAAARSLSELEPQEGTWKS